MLNTVFLQEHQAQQFPWKENIKKKIDKGIQFIVNFKTNKNFHYELLINPNTQLRQYQIEGVNWIGFLTKYNLHGALCDDMGLGKTLQILTVIQNEIFKIQSQKGSVQASLVICPSTLTEHWFYEIKKFMDLSIIKPIILFNDNHKEVLEKKQHNLLIISYNNLQKNIEIMQSYEFHFCVLDEGHLIKNAKSKVSKCIKQIKAIHRFLLTGTPIQNNILELWSIFDFLMPDYLGSEQYFKNNFSREFHTNILSFSDSSLIFSDKQQQILTKIHQQVLPFILRRDKQQVLKELPQKIIQDYYCHMSDLQKELYAILQNDYIPDCEQQLELCKTQKRNPQQYESISKTVIQSLLLMRKICDHPYLALSNDLFKCYAKKLNQSEVSDYKNSGKLLALKQILLQLNFEQSVNDNQKQTQESTVLEKQNPNKILIFSRFKQTLDLIQKEFLNKCFPKINYQKLDGSVPSQKRFQIVRKFNEDPEEKILLLTTQVGGFGLNLQTANIVIMFDHDYNPSNDMQAIDRAHRIGQKNTLNVYRLITTDTLEESIMGIQQFKLNIANSIVNMDNTSIKNIKESNIISLFDSFSKEDFEQQQKKEEKHKNNRGDKFNPYSKILENLDELWNEEDYYKEY